MKNWTEHLPDKLEYKGKYIANWFSNMLPSLIVINGLGYESVENFYQSMKTFDKHKREEIRLATPSGSKYLARKIKLRGDWRLIKEFYMKQALEEKFKIPEWRDKLLATGDSIIVEWNNWNDKEWGATLDGIGNNKLGIMLMNIREETNKINESNTQ